MQEQAFTSLIPTVCLVGLGVLWRFPDCAGRLVRRRKALDRCLTRQGDG
jgi:hypothetical protein